MTLALALALASALATSVAFLLKQRSAVLAPEVRVRHPLRSAAALFRSRRFARGWVVAVGAWGLHVVIATLAGALGAFLQKARRRDRSRAALSRSDLARDPAMTEK